MRYTVTSCSLFLCLFCLLLRCSRTERSQQTPWVGRQNWVQDPGSHLQGTSKVLGPHPADGHPEGLSLQALQDPSQFCTGTGWVLLDEDPVHQVSVLLIDLDSRLTHLLKVLVLDRQRIVKNFEHFNKWLYFLHSKTLLKNSKIKNK